MHPYAQTNIQLFNQVHALEYGPADLEAVVSAYALAMSLHTGWFRPSGKTFIAHLVGTGSILASLRVEPAMVAAGLLHAAYAVGDFGDERPGVNGARRDRVRAAVGERAEEYVFRYHSLPWTDQSVRGVAGGLDAMTPMDRDVVLMRLANELEEFLDLGIRYCGEQKRLQTSGSSRCRQVVEIAGRLGFPGLAAELASSIDEAASASVPAELLGPRAPNSSFLLAPSSYQRLKGSLLARLAGSRGLSK